MFKRFSDFLATALLSRVLAPSNAGRAPLDPTRPNSLSESRPLWGDAARALGRRWPLVALACLALGTGSAVGTNCYEEIDPYYWGFDVPSMIHARTPDQAAAVRASMVDYLWAGGGYPYGILPAVQHLPCDGDPPPARGPFPSDFPKSFSGLALWLDAADATSVLTNGGKVFRWRDKSGLKNDASQSSAAMRPLYVASGINTKPAISFDGLDDFLDVQEAPSLDVANLTLFVVVRFSDPSISAYPTPLAKLPMDSAYQLRLDFDKTPMAQVSIQGQPYPTADMGVVSGNAEIWSVSHDGRTLRMYRNEWPSEYAPPAPGAIQGSSGSLRIGAGEAGYTTTFGGWISEVLLYNRALSEADRRQVEEYLGWKYGIFQAWPGWIGRIGSGNIGCVDRLDLGMDHGWHAYSYLLRPKTAVNRLLLYHQGHSDFLLTDGGQQLLQHFLDRGFAVMTFWMPLFGENPKTVPDVQGSARTLFSHDEMPLYLEDSRGSFIRFFLEPVVAALNYVSTSFSFDDINMAGISGGGWTTHLTSALDTRIGLSFPTAGSLPEYLHGGPCATGAGDAEQEWAPFYQRAGWPDIYVLGGYGPFRSQTQVLNQYDSCCFWGVNYRTYEPTVVDAVNGFGAGAYSVHLDSTHLEHKISDAVINGVIDPTILAQVLPYRPRTDLTLTQRDAPDPVRPGAPLVYTLNVKNNGPSRARNVTLADTLPANVTLVSATPSQGICTGTSAVTCLLGDLAEGRAASVTLVVSAGTAGFLMNTAEVSYDLSDFRPSDNLSAEPTLVDPDQDQDGVGDSADCAPLDPTAFAIPPEISGVSFGLDGTSVQWNSAVPGAGSGVTYDVMRGNLQDLGTGLGAGAVCLVGGISTTQWNDAALPLVGESFWYLVRGGNTCGQGTLGTDSNGTPRVCNACVLFRTSTPALK